MNTADRSSNTLSRVHPSAQEIADRLIDSRRSERAGGVTAAQAAAAAFEHLYRELSRWVGPDGCRALFTRALADARSEHPTLAQIQLRARSELRMDDAETIIAQPDAVTAEALEAMLVRLVELLGRLIGTDMAMKLLERSMVASEAGDVTSDGIREEA